MPQTATTIVTSETGEEIGRTERKRYTLAELKELDESYAYRSDKDSRPGGYDRALEKLAERTMEYEWWDTTLDSEVDYIAEKYGISYDPKEVTFDLDRGAMFSFGKASVNARVLLKRAGLDLRKADARTLIESGLVMGEQHLGGGDLRPWIGLTGGYEDIPDWASSDETADAIRDVLREAQDEMLTTLRDEQEYRTSEGALAEDAEANDMRFYESGEVA